MDYFSDLSFVCYGNVRNIKSPIFSRKFDDYYGIQFIRSGGIFVKCEGKTAWKHSGPLVFITGPGPEFSYGTPYGFRDQIYICFKGERVQRYLESGLLTFDGGERIPITAPEELSSVMESAIRLLRCGTTEENHGKAVLLLEKALLLIKHQPQLGRREAYRRESIRELAGRISEHPECEWDFKKESAELNLSEVHFRRLFQQENGIAPLQFVLNHRIETAAQLLVSTDMLIKEIAYECGFGGEFYFSRQFRKIKKISPTEYRKQFILKA